MQSSMLDMIQLHRSQGCQEHSQRQHWTACQACDWTFSQLAQILIKPRRCTPETAHEGNPQMPSPVSQGVHRAGESGEGCCKAIHEERGQECQEAVNGSFWGFCGSRPPYEHAVQSHSACTMKQRRLSIFGAAAQLKGLFIVCDSLDASKQGCFSRPRLQGILPATCTVRMRALDPGSYEPPFVIDREPEQLR